MTTINSTTAAEDEITYVVHHTLQGHDKTTRSRRKHEMAKILQDASNAKTKEYKVFARAFGVTKLEAFLKSYRIVSEPKSNAQGGEELKLLMLSQQDNILGFTQQPCNSWSTSIARSSRTSERAGFLN
ncbi:hypothetical protein OIO90_004329 [Microbotryomycetes sp. JL221]|nr:hypothetical protein OIO90_004329 [Microbotryomycetes sp. JL221]